MAAAKNNGVRWEYWVVTSDLSDYQSKLSLAGTNCWELVSVITRSEYLVLTFKRVKH